MIIMQSLSWAILPQAGCVELTAKKSELVLVHKLHFPIRSFVADSARYAVAGHRRGGFSLLQSGFAGFSA